MSDERRMVGLGWPGKLPSVERATTGGLGWPTGDGAPASPSSDLEAPGTAGTAGTAGTDSTATAGESLQ